MKVEVRNFVLKFYIEMMFRMMEVFGVEFEREGFFFLRYILELRG